MNKEQINRLLLLASTGCFLVMSVSFLIMPVEGAGVIPGVMFWGGLAAGIILQSVLTIRRRKAGKKFPAEAADKTLNRVLDKSQDETQDKTPDRAAEKTGQQKKRRNGLMTFFSNPYAKIADIAFAVSLPGTILAFVLTGGMGYSCYVFIMLSVFSLCMHCVLNGGNYVYVIEQKNSRQMPEKVNNQQGGEETK